MADIDFSLDEYIKTKKKQGGFKVNAAKRAQVQRKGKVAGAAAAIRGSKSKRGARFSIARAARQGQKNQQQIRQNRQASWKRARGGNRSRLNRSNNQQNRQGGRINATGGGVGATGQRRFNRRNRSNLNLNLSGGGRQAQQYSGFQNRGKRNGNNRGAGISQHLSRGIRQNRGTNRRARAAGQVILQSPRVGGTPARFLGNRRAVLKIAQKRVQNARLQLTKIRRGNSRRIAAARPLMPLLSLTSGVRRVRNGFVTVKHPVEKQIQRLVIKEKIEKARHIRINRNFANTPRNIQRQRQSPQRRPRAAGGNRYLEDTYRSRPALNQYDPEYPEIPRMGMSMYADQEGRRPAGASGMAGRGHWNPPLVRTTINHNAYQHQSPSQPSRSSDDFDHPNQRLNPEIQRKISFIQSRTRNSDSPGIIPDFRAPIASSTMKLGDRFKMYMQ